MAFGSSSNDTFTKEIGGVEFTINRMDTKIRKKFAQVSHDNTDRAEFIKQKRALIVDELISKVSGLTWQYMQENFVNDATHYASKTFDVSGDQVTINRASFEDVFSYTEALEGFDYETKASIAIDELLVTQDAKIEHQGKVKKLNQSIKDEIKSSDSWESAIVDPIWDMATGYKAFAKPSSDIDADKSVSWNSSTKDYIKKSHQMFVGIDVLEEVFKLASQVDNYLQAKLAEDIEAGKH